MALRLIGAGTGRTGTHSLKLALERLLDGPCHHMSEVYGHPETVPVWQAAAEGEAIDWEALLDGYVASVDLPGSALWREQAAVWPDAVVLLSTRADAEAWFRSADRTILVGMREPPSPGLEAWRAMIDAIMAKQLTTRYDDHDALVAAYDRHNAAVRAEVPADRLVEWQPGDGWEPLSAALGVAVPDEPFPHSNTTEEFRARNGWD